MLSLLPVSEILPNVKTIFEVKALLYSVTSYPVLPYGKTPCKQGKLRSQVFESMTLI